MKSLMTRTGAVLLGLAGPALMSGGAWAARPEPWQLGLQPAVGPVAERIVAFHDVLLWVIFAIALFVLALLVYVCVRFRASANPTPSRTTHNTVLEVLWTAIPVIILVLIAIPSFRYLYYMDRAVDPDMSIKVTANQWFWNYEYLGEDIAFDSFMIRDADLQPGQLRLLEVDNRLVLPVNKKIQVFVTSNDVMHSFFIPSAVVQIYGIAGRSNETWMQFDREGVYYGQCNQICGIDHSFMPIVVEVLSEAAYAEWLKEAREKFAAGADAPLRVVAAQS